ncbi:unnamed protein product [Caenorhabditis angaria]|uniref:C-CAP/cofactor C-like domain-containing protein n=1 Tax=Caenorhabditis angaria TaxID=860376 RepID=A0A9P1MXG7_9PELO|nr:unnamed protein product [Caenorhabditis angaria]
MSSASASPATCIYLWVRSIRSLQNCLFFADSAAQFFEFENVFRICRELQKCEGKILFPKFSSICGSKMPEQILEAIFQNAPGASYSTPLIVALIFAALQNNSRQNGSRAENILENLKSFFSGGGEFLGFLRRNSDVLDEILEGTVKSRGTRNCVRPASEILTVFDEADEPNLAQKIISSLILDPYHIDEIPMFARHSASASASASFRRTTLAHNTRRVVHLHNVNKFELFRKDDFANVHLRICHDKPKASFIFALLSLESVILDSLEFCRTTVLGAVRGTVVLSNCKFLRVTVACSRLHLIDCQHLEVYCMLPTRPVVTNCVEIEFAPLNTTYMNHSEFLASCGLDFQMNRELKEPINLGNSAWKLMAASKFICQLTPVETSENDIDLLLSSLPEIYRRAAHNNTIVARKKLNSSNLRLSDVISNRDLIYLKSKREAEAGENC